ncbi:hypothetical protein [Clostridium lacusfryxellense]|uniref:hypothetical protein n=1 Tax=Clostridium lacusfryxellense TaxID=205328 RepID=UPI001C0D57BF|nr:hypothetical protein [Clostridium lacusfryxellense]MBU3114442.1 hypothetical protein [Clostridium lacusfryxellense]
MKKEKIDKQEVELILVEFKAMYEPKNRIIDGILLKGQNELSKGQVPQLVLQRVVGTIYQVIFIEKVNLGIRVGVTFKKMEELAKANDCMNFGSLFNCRYDW